MQGWVYIRTCQGEKYGQNTKMCDNQVGGKREYLVPLVFWVSLW